LLWFLLQSITESDFSAFPHSHFVLLFLRCFFTAAFCAIRDCAGNSAVLSPEDRADPSKPPLQPWNEFQFYCTARFFSSTLLLSIEMERYGKEQGRSQVCGLGQVRSGSGILVNRKLATESFFMDSKSPRSAAPSVRTARIAFLKKRR
jgi:hypothetical protein